MNNIMQPVQTPITGSEALSDLAPPLQALSQFYKAFNGRDLQLMSQNWLQSSETAMDNPLGGIKRGWKEIQVVYERVFQGPARVHVEFYDYTLHAGDDMFYAVGRERGSLRMGDQELSLAIRTTRIFKRVGTFWKQVHHHGSIETPELLAKYQGLILGR
jgi:limonene-1,2-epoxide hydrolase